MNIFPRPSIWIAAGVVFAIVAGRVDPSTRLSTAPLPAPILRPTAPQELVVDPVDGEPAAGELAERRPLAVVIDNFPDARPQWGLSLASRVYEAITEGGITRYLAVFDSNDADRVGPVRSVRTQFLNYVFELDAALAHVGGNADALGLMGMLGIKDLDQFRHAGPYRRIPAPKRAIEHTMYASTLALRGLIDQRHWGRKVPIDRRPWKDDAPRDLRPVSQEVTIDFSSPQYRVAWLYQPGANEYARFVAARPDVDAASGTVISAKLIAIAVVPRVQGRTRIGEETWTFSDIGEGPAWVLQDGTVVEGLWQKPSRADRLRFLAAGREVAFDRGHQWIEIIPPEVTPAFQPARARLSNAGADQGPISRSTMGSSSR